MRSFFNKLQNMRILMKIPPFLPKNGIYYESEFAHHMSIIRLLANFCNPSKQDCRPSDSLAKHWLNFSVIYG